MGVITTTKELRQFLLGHEYKPHGNESATSFAFMEKEDRYIIIAYSNEKGELSSIRFLVKFPTNTVDELIVLRFVNSCNESSNIERVFYNEKVGIGFEMLITCDLGISGEMLLGYVEQFEGKVGYFIDDMMENNLI